MKRLLAAALCLAALFLLAGCRRRIEPEARELLRETYPAEIPAPDLPGDETRPEGVPEDPSDSRPAFHPSAPLVDQETPAQGGEAVENAPDPPKAGENLTVILDPNGGECGTGSLSLRAGAVYGELPVPIRPGHTFLGWFTAPREGFSVDAGTVVTIRRDHTLYAQWSEFVGYTVTFDPSGGRLSAYHREKRVIPGKPYGELPTPYYSGYLLTGWFTAPIGGQQVTGDTIFLGTGDQTLYARWEYSPREYWAYVLENTGQKIFSCQEVRVYLELEPEGMTQAQSSLLSAVCAVNIAQNLDFSQVSDGWVENKNPDVIVKIAPDMASSHAVQTAMEARFPGRQVYVLPAAVLNGTEEERLFYSLTLAGFLYPQHYPAQDIERAGRELGAVPG